jgi:hypothetical protein
MAITHSFVSAKPDCTDDTIVRPTDWNSDHVIAEVNGTSATFVSGSFGTLISTTASFVHASFGSASFTSASFTNATILNASINDISTAGMYCRGTVWANYFTGNDLTIWDAAGHTDGVISVIDGLGTNALSLDAGGGCSSFTSSNRMFYFRTFANLTRFIENGFSSYLDIDLTGVNPQIKSSTGILSFDNENLLTTGGITTTAINAISFNDEAVFLNDDMVFL